MQLKIEYIPIDELKPYERNNKKHVDYDIDEIAKSVEKYGFNDPIGIWKDNIIIEGHGRLEACKKLGITEVPCVRLDHLTDKQRREYAIMHNKTSELAEYDFDNLKLEIDDLDLSDFNIDFVIDDEEVIENNIDEEDIFYTEKTDIPQYKPMGENVSLEDCMNTEKYKKLLKQIEKSSVAKEEKDFLISAATRHYLFNYKKIAEYYANASSEMQELMETSALVIIDYNDAIKNGYAKLRQKLLELRKNE